MISICLENLFKKKYQEISLIVGIGQLMVGGIELEQLWLISMDRYGISSI